MVVGWRDKEVQDGLVVMEIGFIQHSKGGWWVVRQGEASLFCAGSVGESPRGSERHMSASYPRSSAHKVARECGATLKKGTMPHRGGATCWRFCLRSTVSLLPCRSCSHSLLASAAKPTHMHARAWDIRGARKSLAARRGIVRDPSFTNRVERLHNLRNGRQCGGSERVMTERRLRLLRACVQPQCTWRPPHLPLLQHIHHSSI